MAAIVAASVLDARGKPAVTGLDVDSLKCAITDADGRSRNCGTSRAGHRGI
jgi:hypothetical protein